MPLPCLVGGACLNVAGVMEDSRTPHRVPGGTAVVATRSVPIPWAPGRCLGAALALLPCLLLLSLPAARCCPSLTTLARAIGIAPTGIVYNVADLRTHLAYDAGSWIGRTLRVRGIAGTCVAAVGPVSLPCLYDAGPTGSDRAHTARFRRRARPHGARAPTASGGRRATRASGRLLALRRDLPRATGGGDFAAMREPACIPLC